MCVKTKIRLLFVSLLSTELHGRHGFHGKRIKKIREIRAEKKSSSVFIHLQHTGQQVCTSAYNRFPFLQSLQP